jgi:hypothetical protein
VASQVRKYTSGRLIVDWLITAYKAKLDAAITQDRMAAEPLRQKHLGQDEGAKASGRGAPTSPLPPLAVPVINCAEHKLARIFSGKFGKT